MKILVACEESQRVCIAFREKGHEAYSCDILPCSGGHPEWHLQCDVSEVLAAHWDMVIAFPPCTFLTKASACRLYPKAGCVDELRYQKGVVARDFFMMFYNLDCPRVAIENPVPLRIFNLPPCSQEIQPYLYDPLKKHPYTKRTRLWLRGLPLLVPTSPGHKPLGPWVPSMTSLKRGGVYNGAAVRGNDSLERSKTPLGVAAAMAEQWG